MGADLKSIHRGIADDAMRVRPIMNDAELTGVIEETVDVVHDNDVEIEKQRDTFQIRQWITECTELEPGLMLEIFRNPDFGQGEMFDFGIEPGGVVGKTDKTVRPRQVTAGHRMQRIDMPGAVRRTPFHADHVVHRLTIYILCRSAGAANSTTRPRRNPMITWVSGRSFANAEPRKDLAQQIVGSEFAGQFTQTELCLA